MKPIFIFSLPRSGSTLLQRILATSQQISTAAEPWILLPYVYTLKSGGVISEYSHSQAVEAIKDFYEGYPKGKKDYLDELRKFVLNLYKKRSHPESQYFLDKTPRYHLIADEIIKIFPDGKFIFLWRNPLAVVSSMVQSWYSGKWKIRPHNIDLYAGYSNMLNTFVNNKSTVHSLNYEKLVQYPSTEVTKLCDYLGVIYKDEMIYSFKGVPLKGRMGDKIGRQKYNSLNNASLETWKQTFNNPFRRYWARRYLSWIGKEKLKIMGYDHSTLNHELGKDRSFSMDYLLYDLTYTIFMRIWTFLCPLDVHHNKSVSFLFK